MTTFAKKYYATFTSDSGLFVQVLMGDSAAYLTGGFGGWEVVDRPRRIGMVRFKGRDPLRQDIPVRFEGVREHIGQEVPIATLIRMSMIPAENQTPPLIDIDGPVMREDLAWVIEDITFDNQNTIWEEIGGTPVRTRQDAVVHLLEYVDDDVIITAPTPAIVAGGGKTKKTITSSGQTAKQLAQIAYGDPNAYFLIFGANPILTPDPRLPIPHGAEVVIP